MKELFSEKVKRYLHGTIFFPHNLIRTIDGVFCTCGYKKDKKKSIIWRNYLPSIRFRLHIPFVRVETTVMYERVDMYGIEWYGLDIQIWKWHFNFQVYWKPI